MTIITRRTALLGLGAGAAALAAPAIIRPASAQNAKIRLGYLPVIPSDGHIWIGDHHGFWAEEGVEFEYIRFGNGVEQFQALVGGSIDVLSAGAALANFPSRGQGKVFLAGYLERASTQIWANPDMGVTSLADLKGKQVATARGTTGELLLKHALQSVGLKIGTDVELVNQTLPNAVAGFVTGSIPAVSIWVPFDLQIKARMPAAVKLTDAGEFFPATAVLDGWATSNAFHQNNRDALVRVARGWLKANDYFHRNRDAALTMLHENRYSDLPFEQVQTMLDALTIYSNDEWRELYENGSITQWLNQTTDFFAEASDFTPDLRAEEYFDREIFLEALAAG